MKRKIILKAGRTYNAWFALPTIFIIRYWENFEELSTWYIEFHFINLGIGVKKKKK